MIPLYFKHAGFAEPEAGIFWVLASNGMHVVRKTSLFTAVTRASTVPGLLPQQPGLRLHLPPIPCPLMETIYGFFTEVCRQTGGEAIVLLYYSPESSRYLASVPPQQGIESQWNGGWVKFMRLKYGSGRRPEGYLKIGDIHSHAHLPAEFSGIDDADDSEDGLRIVLGRVHRQPPDIAASFVTGGTRFFLRAEDVCEPFTGRRPPPAEWLRNVARCAEVADEHGR